MDYLLNDKERLVKITGVAVLNLIINGLPSKPHIAGFPAAVNFFLVLNLIINGLPSKH